MTCQEARLLMDDVFDGELAEQEAEGLHRHLRRCPACVVAWHSAWRFRELLHGDEVPDPGEPYFEEATASIVTRVEVEEEFAKPAPRSAFSDPLRYGPLAIRGVAATILFGLGIYFGVNVVAPAATDAPVAWRSELRPFALPGDTQAAVAARTLGSASIQSDPSAAAVGPGDSGAYGADQLPWLSLSDPSCPPSGGMCPTPPTPAGAE